MYCTRAVNGKSEFAQLLLPFEASSSPPIPKSDLEIGHKELVSNGRGCSTTPILYQHVRFEERRVLEGPHFARQILLKLNTKEDCRIAYTETAKIP